MTDPARGPTTEELRARALEGRTFHEPRPDELRAATEPIRVWPFHDAQLSWQRLSQNGGDEDWIAFVPATFPGGIPLFLDEGTIFGCCTVETHVVAGGWLLIGCHS